MDKNDVNKLENKNKDKKISKKFFKQFKIKTKKFFKHKFFK